MDSGLLRVRNWPVYEAALRMRGELTLWFSEEAVEAWHAPASGKPGGQRIYSDLAIETALVVRAVYHLGLRQTEGFLRSASSKWHHSESANGVENCLRDSEQNDGPRYAGQLLCRIRA